MSETPKPSGNPEELPTGSEMNDELVFNDESEMSDPEIDMRKELLAKKTLAWALWRIFAIPYQAKREEQGQSLEDESFSPEDAIPDSNEQRLAGIMNYIRSENGLLSFEELLCVDWILGRQESMTPSTPGIERYDDWGISQWGSGVQDFMDRFFRMDVAERRKEWESMEEIVCLSPEIRARMLALKAFLDVPGVSPKTRKTQRNGEAQNPDALGNSPNDAAEADDTTLRAEEKDGDGNGDAAATAQKRSYPANVSPSERQWFDLLSATYSVSNRQRALDVLRQVAGASDQQLKTMRRTIRSLLRKFPALNCCNPYLIHLALEGESPVRVSSVTSEDYATISLHVTPFFYPIWLNDRSGLAARWERFRTGRLLKRSIAAFVLTLSWLALLVCLFYVIRFA